MTCRDISKLVSAQLDGRLRAPEEARLEAHLSECAICRVRATELRCLREDLQLLDRRVPSLEISAGVMAALQHEARLQARAARSRKDRLDVWRMRLFSQGVGAVVSLALFAMLTSVILKPIYRTVALAQVVAEEAGYTETADEIRQLRWALMPPLPNNPRPVFDPSGALLFFSKSFSGDDEVIVAVKIGADGRASVQQVVEPPRDPAVLTRLSTALYQQASFQPAARRGRFISSDAVLMFSKVNIPG
jgi:hypothetical protein